MDLELMKAAVVLEGVLSGTSALELFAEVESLTALCDGYRGERDALKARFDKLQKQGARYWMTEEFIPIERHRCEVKLAAKNLTAETERLQSALTRARAEGMEEGSRTMRIRAANAMRQFHSGKRGSIPASVIMSLPLVTEAAKGENSET